MRLHPHASRLRRPAVTLTEIVVVLAIISTLSTLGFTAYFAASKFANKIETEANDAALAAAGPRKSIADLRPSQQYRLPMGPPPASVPQWRGPDGPISATVDLRPQMPPIYNQGAIGSCVDNALAAILQYDGMREGGDKNTPSRLFLYYNARTLQGDVNYDGGSSIHNAIRGADIYGYCDETLWPYITAKEFIKPSTSCYAAAKKYCIRDYHSVKQDASHIKSAIAGGNPVIFGFTVYASFETTAVATTGIVPMPKKGEKILGGHGVLAVGYSDPSQMYLCRNSWGTSWGIKGYFWMPYAYVNSNQLAGDFWVVNSVPK